MILHVRAVEAKDLPKMDVIGKSDPFLTFRINVSKETYKTKFIKQTLDPKWNEEFHIPVPNQDCVLHVELFDMDKVSANDLISTRDFELNHFKVGEVYEDWYHFFKAPGVDKPGSVYLVFHLANNGDTPFVRKQ